MKTLIRAALAALLVGTLASVVSSPASAHPSVCVGTGEAHTPPLGYPVSVTPTGLRPASNGAFSLTIGAGGGIGGCVSANGLNPLIANGTLTGWCGHSTGDGVLLDGGGSHDFDYVSAGSIILVIPDVLPEPGTLGVTVGIANATPLPGAGGGSNSCLTGEANTFQVTGVVVNGTPLPV